MFTGITRGTFAVVAVHRDPDLLRYGVELPAELTADLKQGASVAVDGVCQTVVARSGQRVDFEAIRETLDRTTLGDLRQGERVSIERSYRVGDEIGGHELSGHVIGTAQIVSRQVRGDVCDLRLGCDPGWMKYIQPKGFIGVDGSSLTVGEVQNASFDIHLIPETIRLTNLGDKPQGARVNIELDARTVTIVDTVERVVAAQRKEQD